MNEAESEAANLKLADVFVKCDLHSHSIGTLTGTGQKPNLKPGSSSARGTFLTGRTNAILSGFYDLRRRWFRMTGNISRF
jgi:hypothetical protein